MLTLDVVVREFVVLLGPAFSGLRILAHKLILTRIMFNNSKSLR
jgi:hypothetical protein